MEQYGIEFNEAARQQTSDRKALRRLLKGNIALVVVLEELGGNDAARAPRRQRKVSRGPTRHHHARSCAMLIVCCLVFHFVSRSQRLNERTRVLPILMG
jgi:hypothetical protein